MPTIVGLTFIGICIIYAGWAISTAIIHRR